MVRSITDYCWLRPIGLAGYARPCAPFKGTGPFFHGAATPPFQGGDFSPLNHAANGQTPVHPFGVPLGNNSRTLRSFRRLPVFRWSSARFDQFTIAGFAVSTYPHVVEASLDSYVQAPMSESEREARSMPEPGD